MKNVSFRTWTVPPALLALCALSFGILAPWLGFYWDDWPTIWYLHMLGPSGFLDVFQVDRPLLGGLFTLTTAVLGESTLGWQLFGVLTRWTCCLALWWTLSVVWPQHPRPVTWTVFLFAVYPGFTQQYIAVTYSNAWIILAVFLLSLGIMVLAVRRPRTSWPLLAVSALLSALVMAWSEYFFGLEFLRPLLLWWAREERSGDIRRRLQAVLLRWLPYLAVIALFLYWRTFIHENPRGQVQVFDLLGRDPSGTLFDLARTVLLDMFQSSLAAWGQVLDFPRLASYGRGPLALYLAIVLISIPLAGFYLAKFRPQPGAGVRVFDYPRSSGGDQVSGYTQPSGDAEGYDPALTLGDVIGGARSWLSPDGKRPAAGRAARSRPAGQVSAAAGAARGGQSVGEIPARISPQPVHSPDGPDRPAGTPAWGLQAIGLGLLALLVGGLPFWVTYLPIELRFPWDRFTLAMMLGASLLLAGLLDLAPGRQAFKVSILGLAIGLAVGFHVQNANLYRREWNLQKAFFWQLAWRAPGIQPGTALLTAELPFNVFSDNSLTAPLNWIYAPEHTSRQMPYLLYAVESRLEAGLPRLEPGMPIEQPYRATFFEGSTSQAVAIFSEPPGCVKVVDPVVDARLPQKPNYIDELLTFSDPGRIIPRPGAPARPPQAIFGPEPEHGWCYYFEKADLARQMGDWQQVAALGRQAFQLQERLYEVNAAELVPYIEGYAHVGQWEKARELTLEAQELTFRMKRMLCATWQRIEEQTSPSLEGQATVAAVTDRLKCAAP